MFAGRDPSPQLLREPHRPGDTVPSLSHALVAPGHHIAIQVRGGLASPGRRSEKLTPNLRAPQGISNALHQVLRLSLEAAAPSLPPSLRPPRRLRLLHTAGCARSPLRGRPRIIARLRHLRGSGRPAKPHAAAAGQPIRSGALSAAAAALPKRPRRVVGVHGGRFVRLGHSVDHHLLTDHQVTARPLVRLSRVVKRRLGALAKGGEGHGTEKKVVSQKGEEEDLKKVDDGRLPRDREPLGKAEAGADEQRVEDGLKVADQDHLVDGPRLLAAVEVDHVLLGEGRRGGVIGVDCPAEQMEVRLFTFEPGVRRGVPIVGMGGVGGAPKRG